MGSGSASQSWPCTEAIHCTPCQTEDSPSTSALTSPTLQDSSGCCWRQPGESMPALAPTAHPHCRERDKYELPRPPTSFPTSPASLRCVPSHKGLCQNKCGSLAACGRSHAGLKYSIHMVKSGQMQLFLFTNYTVLADLVYSCFSLLINIESVAVH